MAMKIELWQMNTPDAPRGLNPFSRLSREVLGSTPPFPFDPGVDRLGGVKVAPVRVVAQPSALQLARRLAKYGIPVDSHWCPGCARL